MALSKMRKEATMEGIAKVEDLESKTMGELLALYNAAQSAMPGGGKPVQRFKDHAAAVRRVWALAEADLKAVTQAGPAEVAEGAYTSTEDAAFRTGVRNNKKRRAPAAAKPAPAVKKTVVKKAAVKKAVIAGLSMGENSNRARLFAALSKSKGKYIKRQVAIDATYKDSAPANPSGALARVIAGIEALIERDKLKLEIRTRREDGVSQLGLFEKGTNDAVKPEAAEDQ